MLGFTHNEIEALRRYKDTGVMPDSLEIYNTFLRNNGILRYSLSCPSCRRGILNETLRLIEGYSEANDLKSIFE